MDSFRIREFRESDLTVVAPLLDSALGRGFWNPCDLTGELALVAVSDDVPIGVGAASLEREDDGAAGHIRLVAVDPGWRGKGVATALVDELVDRCEDLGATTHLTYAWVHGRGGKAPLAGVLTRAGFHVAQRLESFYSGAVGGPCPSCGQTPCVCPTDLYVRAARGPRS